MEKLTNITPTPIPPLDVSKSQLSKSKQTPSRGRSKVISDKSTETLQTEQATSSKARARSAPSRTIVVGPKNEQVRNVMLCLNSHQIKSKAVLAKELKTIVNELFLKKQFNNLDTDQCLSVFNNGILEYANIHHVSVKKDAATDALFKKHLNELRAVEQVKPAQATAEGPAIPPPASAMAVIHTQAIKDIQALEKTYDQLKQAKETLTERSDALTQLVQQTPVVKVPKVIIGAGDMGTTLWLEKHKSEHRKAGRKIATQTLPDTLMLANDTGKWTHNYTLAQSHRILERETEHTSPSAFTKESTNQQNKYVNARHLYQANMMNLATTEAPVILDAYVKAIQKQENHTTGWQDTTCAYRLQVALPNKKTKYIYTNEVEVAAGLGVAKDIFPSNYITNELYEKLSVFDPAKQCTPIIDGNAFMLTAQEESTEVPRTVIVYGGGGNATACYGKACLGKDIRSDMDHENQENAYAQAIPNRDVFWFSRNGFEPAGYGTLAKQAVVNAQSQHLIFPGLLNRIEYDNKTKKTLVYMEIVKGTYEKEPITARKEDLAGRPVKIFWVFDPAKNKYIQKKAIGFACDQLVVCVGQDNNKLKSAISELGPLQLSTTKEGAVTGVSTADGTVRFFGATASSLSTEAAPYNKETRTWIVGQNLCADAEWPGVMPPSRAQIRLEAFEQTGQAPQQVHAMVDDVVLCRAFLKKAKVVNEAFLKDLVELRKKTSSGASHEDIVKLIHKHKLENKIGCEGHSYLYQIPKMHILL